MIRRLLPLLLLLFGVPAHSASKPDCRSVFDFETNTKLSLFDLKVMLAPHDYQSGDAFMSVQEFDTDFQPSRKGKGAIAIVSAGGRELSDDVAGGMVLSKYAAYFDQDKSEELNKKGGLNAVFYVGQNHECAGTTYTIRFDKSGVLTANGKQIQKVMVSTDP
jgi:hypothetical protein